MIDAPFHADAGRDGGGAPLAPGRAFWLRAEDGVRLRLGHWPVPEGAETRGTVLLFSGRSEYIEKYGITASALGQQGFATISIDWRGQGLSDRLLPDPAVGHVAHFTDYQSDVAAMVAAAHNLNLPRPWFLLAHSMGGAIGLRALLDGLAVNAAGFSAPMWNILLGRIERPLIWAITGFRHVGRLGHGFVPSTGPKPYVAEAAFEDNTLTTDAAMYAMMQRQTLAHPGLAVGGPSLTWLGEALREMRALRATPAPNVPALAIVGGNERIVDTAAIAAHMANWPRGQFEILPGAEHEVLMETPTRRNAVIEQIVGFFIANT